MIKHISFDFWDTLYKGNPNFRIARADYLQDKYGFTHREIHNAVKRTKKLCDGLSEKTMGCVDSTTQAWHLLDQLGCPSIKDAFQLAQKTHEIYIENPPVPLFTLEQLTFIKEKGISISVSCNTGLIAGHSILPILKKNTNHLFDFHLFSDQIGIFKPNPFFMQTTLMHPSCKAKSFEQILHVGDNPNTDGYMCQLTGINYLQNKKGELNFEEIYNYI